MAIGLISTPLKDEPGRVSAKKFKTKSKFIIAANYINESVYKWTLKKIFHEIAFIYII